MKIGSSPTSYLLKALGAILVAASAGVNAQEATSFDWSSVPSTRSGADVHAEALASRADGTLVNRGDVAEFAIAPSTLSRAQVVAETLEARRLGLISPGDLNPPVPTAEQQRMIAEAGLRAIERQRMASK